MKKSVFIIGFLVLIFFVNGFSACSQNTTKKTTNICFQNNDKKLQLINIAEENKYKIRNILVVSNILFAKDPIKKQITEEFTNENEFSLENLQSSLERVNKKDLVKPIFLENIEVRLENDEKRGLVVDLSVCIQKKQNN